MFCDNIANVIPTYRKFLKKTKVSTVYLLLFICPLILNRWDTDFDRYLPKKNHKMKIITWNWFYGISIKKKSRIFVNGISVSQKCCAELLTVFFAT